MRRALALAALLPGAARAFDFEVGAATIGQGDQIRRFSGDGVVLMNRRRLTQILSLRLYDFLPPPDPDSGRPVPRLQMISQMRFDTNFGDFVDNMDADGVLVVPEIEDDQFDLLLLYVEGRDFLRGTTDFRVGRQAMDDPLDWFALDGADVLFRAPLHVGVEGFGGLEVRGDDPLSSPTMELDGTTTTVLSEEHAALAPTFGGALVTHGLRDLSARASYRRTISTAATAACPSICADPSLSDGVENEYTGVVEEKVAASVRGRIIDALYPYGGLRYNLLVARPDLAEAGVRVQIHPRHAVTPAYSRFVPTFAGDSIFNVFSTEAYQDGALTYDVMPRSGLRAYAKGLVRRYANEARDDMDETSATHVGGGAGGRLALRRGFVRLDGRADGGYGGLAAGGDLSGEWRFLVDRLALSGRVSALRYESDAALRDEAVRRGTWSLGLQGGARWVLAEGVALHALAEENRSTLYESYFRLLGMLDLGYRP